MLSLCGTRLGAGSIPGFDIDNNVMSERIDHGGFHLIIASCAVFAPGGTRLGAACIFCFNIDNNIMPKRWDHLLRLQHGIAACAVLTRRKTGFGTGRLHGGIVHHIVTERRHLRLLHAVIASCTMFACGYPVLGASRCNRGIGNNVMSKRRNHGRFYLIIASCTVLAPGCARFGTGRSLRFDINDNVMSKRGDQLLRLQNRIAARAVLAGRKPCLGAGRLHGGIRNCIMPERRNGFLRLENLAAYGAMLPLGQPVFGTTGRNRRINHNHMLMRQIGVDRLIRLHHIFNKTHQNGGNLRAGRTCLRRKRVNIALLVAGNDTGGNRPGNRLFGPALHLVRIDEGIKRCALYKLNALVCCIAHYQGRHLLAGDAVIRRKGPVGEPADNLLGRCPKNAACIPFPVLYIGERVSARRLGTALQPPQHTDKHRSCHRRIWLKCRRCYAGKKLFLIYILHRFIIPHVCPDIGKGQLRSTADNRQNSQQERNQHGKPFSFHACTSLIKNCKQSSKINIPQLPTFRQDFLCNFYSCLPQEIIAAQKASDARRHRKLRLYRSSLK